MSKHKSQTSAAGSEKAETVSPTEDLPCPSDDDSADAAETAPTSHEASPESELLEDLVEPRDERDERIEALVAENEALTNKLAGINDQYLRKMADYENFRKRLLRERDDAINFANTSLLLDLIGIIDNFDRALQATADDPAHLREGIDLIEKQLLSMLENKWGLARFSSKGEGFNPEVHEAIAREDRDDIDEATVTDEFLSGYRLRGRVIRTAKVKVGMPKEPATNIAAATENEAEGKIAPDPISNEEE